MAKKKNKITKSQIQKKVCSIVMKITKAKKVTLLQRFNLDKDELDFIEVIMEIEKHYKIIFPDEKCEEIRTVNNLVQFVEKQLK